MLRMEFARVSTQLGLRFTVIFLSLLTCICIVTSETLVTNNHLIA
jgi:hypothetical protein